MNTASVTMSFTRQELATLHVALSFFNLSCKTTVKPVTDLFESEMEDKYGVQKISESERQTLERMLESYYYQSFPMKE